MFEQKKRLLHCKVEKPNPQYTVLMQEQLGGGNGGLRQQCNIFLKSFKTDLK